MNQLRHLLPAIVIKLMSIEAQRAVTNRLKGYILARVASGNYLPDSWRGQHPPGKQVIEMIDVCLMSFRLLDLQAISSTVSRFQVAITQEKPDENFSLDGSQRKL